MDVASLVLSAAQTLFAALQNSDLRELFSLFGYQTELERLESTVSRVQAVLQDAEAKQVLSKQEKDLFQKLKDAVYDADDLLDEFATIAEQEKQRLDENSGGVSKKVRNLFHHFEKLGVARTMSKDVKKVRKMLDMIAQDAKDFKMKVDDPCLIKRKEETCSYVYEPDIIGREEDTMKIVEMLLEDCKVENNISFLSIVGIGGLGKTALAQLVYNHEKVVKGFTLRLWTCVADQDQKHLQVQQIIAKILESAIDKKHDVSNMELMQKKLHEHLQGKKYLLVLDDVWTEDRVEWLKLRNHLIGGARGSRILVTTRSKRTAQVIGDNPPYELQGLTPTNSWLLFKRMAFEEQEEQAYCVDLVEIGRKIVGKCANVPLAIRVVGSLLYGREKKEWLSLQQSGVAEILRGDNGIISILKLSYHHLPSSMKSCFSYCAIFPKDFVILKEELISLWMAQGYIKPLHARQSIEEAAEEYFLILLRRCFFQDVTRDEYGDNFSFKIHDLMHDVAQQIVGEEICVTDSNMNCLHRKALHFGEGALVNRTESFFTKTKLRSFKICNEYSHIWSRVQYPIDALIDNFVRLRVLDLPAFGLESLPETIGKLLHLRYLNLSMNEKLKMLPKSIMKLQNMQTLDLSWCHALEELPKDLGKLVKLRMLDITCCERLTHMPSSMEKLTCLSRLTMFVVAGANSSLKKKDFSEIEVLRSWGNLKGHLKIKIKKDYAYVKEKGREGYVRNKEHLNHIAIEWEDTVNGKKVNDEEELLEDFQPHCNLKSLALVGYGGSRIPSWAKNDKLTSFLPNLMYIQLWNCHRVQELPWFSGLPYLKKIKLVGLRNLEYMENRNRDSSTGGVWTRSNSNSKSRAVEIENELSFFPSLQELFLWDLPKLEGWWRGSESKVGDHDDGGQEGQLCQLPSFPRLLKLRITGCPKLTCIPLCPTVEIMELSGVNERLRLTTDYGEQSGRFRNSATGDLPVPN